MSPPSIITGILRPLTVIIIVEQEIVPVWALCAHICPRLISFHLIINHFPIHPFVKRTTMIEYSVNNYSHSATVDLFNQPDKQLIAGFQIFFVRCTNPVFISVIITLFPGFQKSTAICHYLSNMWINIIIILRVIFMIGR